MKTEVFAEMPRRGQDALKLALEAARLPTDDIARSDMLFFTLADDDGPIGFIGLEGAGRDRLLRSLVVLPTRRGHGFGRSLVTHLESLVAGDVERLHLLTKDAASFFRQLGYRDGTRSEAPSTIAVTAQFTSLCPASATYLVKGLS